MDPCGLKRICKNRFCPFAEPAVRINLALEIDFKVDSRQNVSECLSEPEAGRAVEEKFDSLMSMCWVLELKPSCKTDNFDRFFPTTS